MHPLLEESLNEVVKQKEELSPTSPLSVNGIQSTSEPKWIDPDTVKLGSQPYRIKGYNAPEVGHIKSGVFVPGEYQGASERIPLLAEQSGFSNLIPQGKDKYGRITAELVNPRTGETLGSFATKTGLAPVNQFTTPEDINARSVVSAFSSLYPEMAKKDPALAASQSAQAEKERIAKATGQPLYAPKINVLNEAQYSGFKRSVGVGAAAEEAKEVERLENVLKEEDLSTDLKNKLTTKLNQARERVFAASTTPDIVGGVQVRSDDRTIMNQAHDQFSTSVTNGWLDIQKQMGGLQQMVGDQAQWDWLSNRSKTALGRVKLEQESLPDTLSSFKDINTGQGSWNTIKDTATYAGNLIGGTLPQMAALIGSTWATGGLTSLAAVSATDAALASVLPPSLMYAGGFYAEQPDDKKNASLAVSLGLVSGVLDRLGLESLVMKNDLFTMAGKKEAVNALLYSGKARTAEAAEKLLESASKKEILEMTKLGTDFAKRQYGSFESMARGLGALTVKGSSEASTETLQQLAEMIAKTGEQNMDVKYERDFYEQLMNAAVGGFGLAGAFHVPGQTLDFAQWHSVNDAKQNFDKTLGEAQVFQSQNQEKLDNGTGGFKDIKQMVEYIKEEPVDIKGFNNNYQLSNFPTIKGFFNSMKEVITDPGRLLRQLAHTAIPTIQNEDGSFKENLAYIKSIMGGYGILPGSHAARFKQNLMGAWQGNTAEELANKLGTNVDTANNMVREAWQTHWSQNQELPKDNPTNIGLQKWKDSMDDLRVQMLTDAKANNVPTDSIANTNALFESSTVHPGVLAANKNKVIDSMVARGATKRESEIAVKNIVSGDKTKAAAARDYMALHGAFEDPALANVFENNLFNSIEVLKDQIASGIMKSKYIGKDGEVLGKLLAKAKAAGEFDSEQDYQRTATEVKAWADIVEGKFHPLDAYPKLNKMLGWLTTFTMLASLSKAALSSQVEVAMSTLGTPANLISKQLNSYVKEFGTEIGSDLNKFGSYSTSLAGISVMRNIPDVKLQNKLDKLFEELNSNPTDKRIQDINSEIQDLTERLTGRKLFEHLGFSETGYNTQSKFEYTDSNMRKAMHVFASAIGLRAQTDSTRMAVLSIAADVMLNHIAVLSQVKPEIRNEAFRSGKGLSKEQANALVELQQYGLDVNETLKVIEKIPDLNPFSYDFAKQNMLDSESKRFQENISTALGNFVDSRVVNPQAHNLPKYYHDPRLRVVTAMTRFMAAAHSTILPRLYKQYLLDGHAGMRYQAFSTIVMAIMFASFANMLKDQLSYGDESPYVKGKMKRVQRNINTSGLLGQFERITDKISPIYPSNGPALTKDPIGWGVDKVKDISPVASWVAKPIQGTKDILEGNTERGVKQLLRAAPVIGSFPIAASTIASAFKQER